MAMVVTAVPRKISCVLRAKVAFCLMSGADDVTSGMSRNVGLLNLASIAAYNPQSLQCAFVVLLCSLQNALGVACVWLSCKGLGLGPQQPEYFSSELTV